MTTQATSSLATGELMGTPRTSLGTHLGALGSHVAAWVGTCADYYQAAALYDQLSGLSNAELNRRGLSRATLAFDVGRGCDRTSS